MRGSAISCTGVVYPIDMHTYILYDMNVYMSFYVTYIPYKLPPGLRRAPLTMNGGMMQRPRLIMKAGMPRVRKPGGRRRNHGGLRKSQRRRLSSGGGRSGRASKGSSGGARRSSMM